MKVVDISTYDGLPLLTSDVDILIQSLGVLFDTSVGEVMGAENFGSDFEKFIWDLSVSNNQISEYIRDIIYNNIYIARKFDIEIDTTIINGTKNDIILVTIDITSKDTGDTYTNTYKIC